MPARPSPLSALSTRELCPSTWRDFESLFGRHGGVQAGCWCMFYQRERPNHAATEEERIEQNRRDHRQRVREGASHGILVYDGERPIGWCQFGRREALPRIDAGRKYSALDLPNSGGRLWRITCFFVDPPARRQGVTRLALEAALRAISRYGGGMVEAYPSTNPRGVAVWFGRRAIFEEQGFRTVAAFGRSNVLMRRKVAPSRGSR